jgi:hypothetical protein
LALCSNLSVTEIRWTAPEPLRRQVTARHC